MIRKSTINLNKANTGKLEHLKDFLNEYNRVVNIFIDELWDDGQFNGSFVKDTKWVDSWLSSRMKQCAAKQALSIVKSQRKRQKKTKPIFNRLVAELDSRFVDIKFGVNSFDIWLQLGSIGNKIKLYMPSKRHRHFNLFFWDDWNLKKSIRLRETDKGFFADLYFEKIENSLKKTGEYIGVDIGYKKLIVDSNGKQYGPDFQNLAEKISRKKQGSKAFKRSLIERDCFINKTVKELDLPNIKTIVIENLKSVKHKSKGKISKKFMNKLQRWSYPKVISRLRLMCEIIGVQVHSINPAYTSQTCSSCKTRDKSARNGEYYSCKNCGLEIDSDYNAALNILHSGLQEHMVPV
jgi:IS605 OrfB family transposase